MTLHAWGVWCELVGELLYQFMMSLPEAELSAFEAGFDAEHRRLFPDFYLD